MKIGIGILLILWQATPPQDAFQEKPDMAKALARARKENLRVLLVWGSAEDARSKGASELFRKDAALRRKLLYEYEIVRIEVGRRDRNTDLAAKYGVDLAQDLPVLTVLSAEGKALGHESIGLAPDAKRLIAFLDRHQAPPRKAGEALEAALKEARDGKKRLMLTFGAPW